MDKAICPQCGKSDYYELYSTTTLIYSPPHYIDGVLVDSDRNLKTVICRCANCNNTFSFIKKAPPDYMKIDKAKYNQLIMRKYTCPKCNYLFFGFEDETKCINCGEELVK